MKSLLLQELEKELLYLMVLQSVLEGEVQLMNAVPGLIHGEKLPATKRNINLEYVKGKIDELRLIIDLIKQLYQE